MNTQSVAMIDSARQQDGRADDKHTNQLNLFDLIPRMASKIASRRKIGWFDFHPLSHDMEIATARAYRIFARLRGERITLREAMTA